MRIFILCRCFVLIENSCFDNPSRLDRVSERTNPEEMYLEVGLFSTFGSIINQCSPEIYEVSLLITIDIYLVFMFNLTGIVFSFIHFLSMRKLSMNIYLIRTGRCRNF